MTLLMLRYWLKAGYDHIAIGDKQRIEAQLRARNMGLATPPQAMACSLAYEELGEWWKRSYFYIVGREIEREERDKKYA